MQPETTERVSVRLCSDGELSVTNVQHFTDKYKSGFIYGRPFEWEVTETTHITQDPSQPLHNQYISFHLVICTTWSTEHLNKSLCFQCHLQLIMNSLLHLNLLKPVHH